MRALVEVMIPGGDTAFGRAFFFGIFGALLAIVVLYVVPDMADLFTRGVPLAAAISVAFTQAFVPYTELFSGGFESARLVAPMCGFLTALSLWYCISDDAYEIE